MNKKTTTGCTLLILLAWISATALAGQLPQGLVYLDQEWWHFTLKDEPFPETYFNFPVQ